MMNSGTEWSATTIQYRLNLPYVLHSISPALSALHASRATSLHPETSAILHPSHCPKCGAYHFSGDHATYLVGPSMRKKRRRATSSRPKALQRRCHLCGFSIDACTSASLNHSSVPVQLPRDLSRTRTVSTIPQTEIGQELPSTDILRPVAGTVLTTIYAASVPPLSGRQSHPKSSHTKTSTLRDMLSRDRQREEVVKARKKKKEAHEGLTAFLKKL